MDTVNLIGRIVLAAFFVHSGIAHFRALSPMAAYTAGKGVPLPRLSVVGSGLVLVLGGISLALGVWADLSALLLTAFLVAAGVLMHDFWTEQNPAARLNEQNHFTKNIALAAATLSLFAFFVGAGPDLGLTLTDPLIAP